MHRQWLAWKGNSTTMNELEKRLLSVLLVCVLCASVIACGAKQDPMEKVKDLDFTVIAEDKLPEELLSMIEEKKASPFRIRDFFISASVMGSRRLRDTALQSMNCTKREMRFILTQI